MFVLHFFPTIGILSVRFVSSRFVLFCSIPFTQIVIILSECRFFSAVHYGLDNNLKGFTQAFFLGRFTGLDWTGLNQQLHTRMLCLCFMFYATGNTD